MELVAQGRPLPTCQWQWMDWVNRSDLYADALLLGDRPIRETFGFSAWFRRCEEDYLGVSRDDL